MSHKKTAIVFAVLLGLAAAFIEELDDRFMETKQDNEIWLIEFYAPWCTFCMQLDPVIRDIAAELRSLGSPVSVGRVNAEAQTGIAKEFRVRLYPAIVMLKNNEKYNYQGARTKDAIFDFANRVAGPAVRSISSQQLFTHVLSHHDVLFLYIGASSLLKSDYIAVAKELIIHTYFFSASRDVLPQSISVPKLPAVLVFKDGTYTTYNKSRDGELMDWIKQERFCGYSKIDSYTLYAMGDTGRLVALALVEEREMSEKSLWYKDLVENIATEHKELYQKDFYFGVMEDSEYVNGLVMGEVDLPVLIVVNLSNDGYFLPRVAVESEQHLLDFLNGVLNGSVECQGGNSLWIRIRRKVYSGKTTMMLIFSKAPLLGCFLVSVPVTLFSLVVYFFYKIVYKRDAEDQSDVSVSGTENRKLSKGTRPSRKLMSKKVN